MTLRLAPSEREELHARLRSRRVRAEDARRARLILLLAAGASYAIAQAARGVESHRLARHMPLAGSGL
jgi:hypothetical protein